MKILLNCGILDDPSTIWWDLRPNVKFPTLEMRICDTCTSLNDAIAIAAIYLCIIHMACRLRRENKKWRVYSKMFVVLRNLGDTHQNPDLRRNQLNHLHVTFLPPPPNLQSSPILVLQAL